MSLETFETKEMELINEMKICFQARSENEGFARVAISGFLTYLNPTISDLEDIKTAVSEAVTNAILHGYQEKESATVYVSGMIFSKNHKKLLQILVEDTGVGMEDISKAMEPLFSTKPEMGRAGMGFVFMNAFMDQVYVESEPGKGTTVTMFKWLDHPEGAVYER